MSEERLARVALNALAEPGDPSMADLVDTLGAVRVRDLLLEQRGLDETYEAVALRLKAIEPDRMLERARRIGLRFVVPGDDEWPDALDGLADSEEVQGRGGIPIGLWVRGPLRLSALTATPSVAVVGARSATSYGEHVAGGIAATCSRSGVLVVSGAAFGIDQAAHRAALACEAPTVAVLACGADRVYPSAHRELIAHIAETGAVVSEAPPGAAPMRLRFLARNRLIAAMTRGTVVVEAALRSGALNTAHWARELRRPLMGVPGPVTSATSQGVHEQIRTGAMTLVADGAHVLEMVGESGEHLLEVPRATERRRDRLTLRQQQVLDAVPVSRGVEAPSIARVAGLGLVETQRALMALREARHVASDGECWRLVVGES